MTLLKSDYRPSNIEFEISSSEVPETLGEFANDKDAISFMQKNFVYVNEKITSIRFIDNFEKSEIRKEYSELLENKLPYLKKDLQKAEMALKEAKDLVSHLKDQVNGTQNEAESLAVQVKIGTKEINLDDNYTWRIAYNDKYFYFTYIDKQIKLAKVREIPNYEKQELYNNQNHNAIFFQKANDIYEDFLSGKISAFDFAKFDLGKEFEILKNKNDLTGTLDLTNVPITDNINFETNKDENTTSNEEGPKI